MRIVLLLAVIGVCCVALEPAQSAASPDPLLRSAGPEVRLRCGSDVLRAKLRGGRLLVQNANGDKAVLTRIAEPRALAQRPVYGDGRLTLYKVKDRQIWALARTGQPGPPVHCTPLRRIP